MKSFSFSSLRVRLILLVLLAVIPALGLVFYAAEEQRRSASIEAQQNALRLARLVSANQHALIEGGRQLLTALAQIPVVRGGHPAPCSAFLGGLLAAYPLYANFGVADPSGDIYCSGVPLKGSVNAADRSWFQRAVQTRDFAIGDYQIGRITGRATVVFGHPILVPREQVRAVVFAAIDLAWFNKLAAKAQLPSGATVTVIDRNRTILARDPDPGQWTGRSMPDGALIKAIVAQQGEGTADATGMDGIPRLYGFASLGGEAVGASVIVGVPKNLAFASANRILARNLIGLGIVAVFALVAAWFGSNLFILRQVNSLTKATKRLAEGELGARTGIPYGKGELSDLARTFDEMAASTERLITERKRSEQRLVSLHEINVATTSSLDLHAVLNVLLEKIDFFLPYPVATTVRLLNRDTGELESLASRGLSEEEWRAQENRSLSGRAKKILETKAPLTVRNVQTDPRTYNLEIYRKYGLTSYLGVPLIAKGEAIGVLGLYTKEEHEFSKEEIEFLSTVAGQAAIAIHNSQLHEQTKRQAAELEKANEIKDEFLGFVSHELRTPVNTIIGYAAMLQNKMFGEINSEQETALEKMMLSSTALLNMMNSLLEATKIEAGAVQVEIHEVHLGKFLEELKSVYDVPLNKELALVWDFPPELPVVKTDGEKVRHILENLINNAIKYTDKGGVTVSARYLADVGAVEFKVADTGIGIPEEALPFIFEKFCQVSGSRPRSSGGVGLGLHIAKNFIELLGGYIGVKSEHGKGSTFTVRIPCSKESQTAAGRSLAVA